MGEAIKDLIEEIKEDFEMFEQWTDRYGYIIDLGKGLELLAEEYHTNEYLVEGCQSRLWLHTEFNDGKMFIYADSDSLIVKGLVSLLIRVYSGQRPEDILNNPPDFFKELGLEANLSPSRANGLNSMIQRINILAESYQKISKS
jgi:cysteine desulfuration protein SufE